MSIFTFLQPSNQGNYIKFYKFIITVSTVSLFGAYGVEYIMKLPPCVLCVYQRYCYFLLIVFSITGVIKANNQKILCLILIILLIATGISGYHAGVERGIFKASDTCASQVDVTGNLSINEIKDILYDKPVASCERAALKIIGLSMTEWNFLLNLMLLLILFKIWKFKGVLNAKA